MTTHWVKQLSLILDKAMTSFLERFWPLLSKSTTEAVFWPLGLRGRVISSIQSFAFPASMDDDDRRRFFLRKKRRWGLLAFFRDTKRRIWWSVDSIMQKIKHGSSRIKKTHLHFQHKCRAIINSKLLKSVKKFSVPKNQSFSAKMLGRKFSSLAKSNKVIKGILGFPRFLEFLRCGQDLWTAVHCLEFGLCKKCYKVYWTHLLLACGKQAEQKVSNVVYLWTNL